MKRLFIFLTLALLASLGSLAPAQAQDTPDHTPDPNVTADPAVAPGPAVIDGRVINQTTVQASDGPHTVSEVEVTNVVAGTITGQTVLVETYGGRTLDGLLTIASHTAELELGESYELSLRPTDPVLAAMLTSDQAIYSVVGGEEGAHSHDPLGPLHAQSSNAYVLMGYHWDSFPLQYQINPAGSGLSEAATIAAVHRSFGEWADDSGSAIEFEYLGTTTARGVDFGDKILTVSWIDGPAPGSGAWLGRASSQFFGDGTFFSTDIVMNDNYRWSVGAQSGSYDVEWVLKHEIGHSLGLGHTPSTSQIMFGAVTQGGSRTLQAGDRAGARALYPQTETPDPTPTPTPTGNPDADDECDGRTVTVDLNTGVGSPTSGRDVILGTPENDVIVGLGGDDIICAGLGVDVIYAGDGNDRIFGQGGSDYIFAGDGNDTIYGGSGADRVYGEDGNDVIFGNGGKDFLWGGAGNDDMQGNWQSDELYGGRGDDILRGAGGKDRLYGETGNDQLYGGLNTDYLNGGIGFDRGDGQQGRDFPVVKDFSGCEEVESISSC